jgi:hypothetical protein
MKNIKVKMKISQERSKKKYPHLNQQLIDNILEDKQETPKFIYKN